MSVPQQSADLGQRSSLPQHFAGERVPELMRSLMLRLDARSCDGGQNE
jgi:hypothetical protein